MSSEERIAFYAVTNLHLVNALNIKLTYYNQNKAVLFIRVANQISYELVHVIQQGDYFEKIVMIPFPVLNNKAGRLGRIPKIRMLNYGERMQNYHDYYLKSIKLNMFFDVAVIPHFWNHAIYYLTYWKMNNPHIRIEFYEEGLSNFVPRFGTFHSMTSPRCSGSKTERAVQRYVERHRMRRISKGATRILYVYNPEMLLENESWVVRKLPSLRENGLSWKLMNSIGSDYIRLLRYSKVFIYYIANHLIPGIEDSYDISYMVIDKIKKIFGPKRFIIKPHTSVTNHRFEYAKQFEKYCYVDREDYFPEAVFANIEEMDSRLFVLRCSALPFNLHNWFKFQPFIIFTYRMFPLFSQTGDPATECVVEKLRKTYDDPSRIMTPSSFLELEMMLKSCKRRMYGLPEFGFEQLYEDSDVMKFGNEDEIQNENAAEEPTDDVYSQL